MAGSAATVRVTGLSETLRALNLVNKAAKGVVRTELGRAVEPVAQLARERIGRYQGASVGTIGPRVTTSSVFVTQRAKKRTGLRGDFGVIQMGHLFDAWGEHDTQVVGDVEDALDRLTRTAGF